MILFAICRDIITQAHVVEVGSFTISLSRKKPCDICSKTLHRNSNIVLKFMNCGSANRENLTYSWVIRGNPCVVGNHNDWVKSEIILNNYFQAPWVNNYEGASGSYTCSDCKNRRNPKQNEHEWRPVSCGAQFPYQGKWWPVDQRNNTWWSNIDHVVAASSQIAAQTSTVQVPSKGNYSIAVCIGGSIPENEVVEIDVEMASENGFLSAVDHPLLNFFLGLAAAYAFVGAIWMYLAARHYSAMYGVYYWIGIALVFELMEKVLLFIEFNSMNNTGEFPSREFTFILDVMSTVLASVVRIVILIISVDNGHVRTKVGHMRFKVMAVGVSHFVLAFADVLIKSLSAEDPSDHGTETIFIPLVVVDIGICIWIVFNVHRTMRSLSSKKDAVKIAKYRNFSLLLLFSVLLAMGFILWGYALHHNTCILAWTEIWTESVKWHMIFFLVHFSNVIIWRPLPRQRRGDRHTSVHENVIEIESVSK